MSKIANDLLNPVWHMMFFIAVNTHMAKVGVKGLITSKKNALKS